MKNKFYITTPIYYVNDRPHIGHALTCIASDVIARYNRRQGKDVVFLTGTAEHGDKIFGSAEKAGMEIQQFVDENAAKFSYAWKNLKITHDDFIRTTEERHEKAVNLFFNKLKESSQIYEGEYKGLYCVGHEAFVKEIDLVDGLCPDHKTKPETLKEKNWFFKLSKYQKELKEKITNDEFKIDPIARKNEILSFIDRGLEDIAISRQNVKFAIPLPWDDEQTIYVWLDELFNYCTAVGYESDRAMFDKYWPADVHVIGKDIIKFHCIIWPALLLAIGEELPKRVYAHGFFTVNGDKMSKTIGNVIDPNVWVKKYGADVVRYFLLREVPFGQDGDVSEKKLEERYNGDLANGLGNLIQRVATLIENNLTGEIFYKKEELDRLSNEDEMIFERFLNDSDYRDHIDNFELHRALEDIFNKISVANKFIDDKKPWVEVKEDPERFLVTMTVLVGMIHRIAWLLQPFIPETTDKIFEIFSSPKTKDIEENHKFFIKKGDPLFPRIS
jgi:methionyl-tRNA synthetase